MAQACCESKRLACELIQADHAYQLCWCSWYARTGRALAAPALQMVVEDGVLEFILRRASCVRTFVTIGHARPKGYAAVSTLRDLFRNGLSADKR